MMISLLAPAWLWLLPAWPLLLMLARRRSERTPVLAPDFELWRRAALAIGEPPRKRAFDRRDLLLLLPVVLWTLALSGPVFRADDDDASVVVLVDRSASMATSENGESRIRRGLRIASELQVDGPARFVGVPEPASDERLSEATSAAVPVDRLLSVAAALYAAGESVVMVTDRADAAAPEGAGLVRVADQATNAGIVACAATSNGIFVRVAGDVGAGPRVLRIENLEGVEIASFRVPDAASGRLVAAESTVGGVVVRLIPPDANPLDDVAVIPALPLRIRTSFDAPGANALLRALRAQPELDIVIGRDPSAALFVARDDVGVPSERPLLLAAPFSMARGFATGAFRTAEGRGRGVGPLADFDPGVDRLAKVFALSAAPSSAVPLLTLGETPFAYADGPTVALLAEDDPEWAAGPGFPLAVRRLVARTGAFAQATAERKATGVLDDEESRSGSAAAALAIAPKARRSRGRERDLAPWLAACGALLASALSIRPFLKGPRQVVRHLTPATAVVD